MHITIAEQLSDIEAGAWNRFPTRGYPFVRHEFLNALARHGAVGGDSGWTPRYLLAWNETALIGALPLYLKSHSWGEFVFDWAWAEAYAHHGKVYYPKLVAAIPYTPCTGPRLLLAETAQTETVRHALIETAKTLAGALNASSLHWLFTSQDQTVALETHGFQRRLGCQYHWHNQGYADFDDYLGRFTAEKRKKVKRERRRVREAGVELRTLAGTELSSREWRAFYRFYRNTFLEKSGMVPLSLGFFEELGATMPEHLVMVLASYQGDYVAAALSFRGGDTLYGRYWGASAAFHSLHFEACYYAGIEYCIREGLQRFEPGAQGEHKISRGFTPTFTYSAHWMLDPGFQGAVTRFLAEERGLMLRHREELSTHLPFKMAEDPTSAAAE
ncbi:MAG: GNAT family N-acetyltransferase [Pseudomonadota bacterium]